VEAPAAATVAAVTSFLYIITAIREVARVALTGEAICLEVSRFFLSVENEGAHCECVWRFTMQSMTLAMD